MSAFEALLMVGIKMVGNMFLNKSESKEEDQRTTTQRLKDEASKAFKETASYTRELKEKAEEIQQRIMKMLGDLEKHRIKK